MVERPDLLGCACCLAGQHQAYSRRGDSIALWLASFQSHHGRTQGHVSDGSALRRALRCPPPSGVTHKLRNGKRACCQYGRRRYRIRALFGLESLACSARSVSRRAVENLRWGPFSEPSLARVARRGACGADRSQDL